MQPFPLTNGQFPIRKKVKRITIYLFLLLIPTSVLAQFTVTGSTGADGNYNSLTNTGGVFSALNGTNQTGNNIVITVTGNSTAETGTFKLNSGTWTSLTMFPDASGYTIRGNIKAPLIELNGADNVTIDGRVNATGSAIDLTIDNTSTSNLGTTSTICFRNAANNNVIRYCNIKGASTALSSGTLFFSTSNGTTGNNNNIVEYNLITNSINRPVNSVFSFGTTGKLNSNNIVRYNDFEDFLNHLLSSTAITLSSNCTSWSITGNSFYETTTFSPSASVTYYIIIIGSTSGNSFTVSDNYIGGSAPLCGSSSWTKTSGYNNAFYGIYLNAASSGSNNMQNNAIQNINWNNTSNAVWTGIQAAGGNINIGTISGNFIGSGTGNGSITITNSNSGTIYGISISGSGTVDCQNNTIGSITSVNTNSNYGTSIYGIFKSASSGTTTISNNIIGSTSTSNSIYASSPSNSSSQVVYGINSQGTGTITITGNDIGNINNNTSSTSVSILGRIAGIRVYDGTNVITDNIIHDISIGNANNSSNQYVSISGILYLNTGYNATISGNEIYNLTNSYSAFGGYIYGLYFNGSTSNNSISGNFVYNLSTSATSSASIYGIRIVSGTTTYSNNIVSLGGNAPNIIYGIYETGDAGNNNNLYFNSIYISGTPTTGSANSYGILSATANNSRNFRNNIIYNARSNNGATGQHFALYMSATGGILTCDYNDYYISGTGGILGYYGSNKTSLPIVTSQDANSFAIDPVFTSPGSSAATDYKIGIDLIGVSGTGITTDYDSNTRNNPTMGAWERVINKWKGGTSTDYNTASNWTGNALPLLANPNIIFDDSPSNHCLLDQNRSFTNITNSNGTYRFDANGHKLTIKGTLSLTAGGQIDASSSGSIIEFAGTSAQSIPSGAFYNDQVYDLILNNSNNVTLNGTLSLLHNFTITAGLLDAYTNNPAIVFEGVSAQTIETGRFVSDRIYDLTIKNGAGVTLNTDFTIDNSLTINSGKIFTISAAKLLTVTGTLTNNGGTSGLVIKSTANGNDGKLINNSSGVDATVELYLKGGSGTYGPAFHYLVPPVQSMTIGSSPAPSIAEVRTALGITNFNGDLVKYDEIRAGSNKNNGWQYFDGYNSTWDFYQLKSDSAYNIYLTSDDKLTFKGQLNGSEHVYSNLSQTALGWNLVGNPFPCNYDLNGIDGLTQSGDEIDNSIYLNNEGGYAYWNVITGGTGGYSDIVPPMQGFFVHVTSPGKSLILPEDYKTGSAAAPLRSKGTAPDEKSIVVKKVKLVLNNGAAPDETIVCLIDDATTGFDSDYDAYKWFGGNSSTPFIYTQLNSVQYAINTVQPPEVDNSITVPVTVVLKSPGTYSINISEFENLDDTKVTLKHGDVETILNQGAFYAFTSGAGTFTDFELIIGETSVPTEIENPVNEKIKTWYSKNFLYINCPVEISSGSARLRIYDIQGKPVDDNQIINIIKDQTVQIPYNIKPGIYLVHILTNNQQFVSKIVVF